MPQARVHRGRCFSALQRAEIAEIGVGAADGADRTGFSALQRAEIAEIMPYRSGASASTGAFQCSSTSRNC